MKLAASIRYGGQLIEAIDADYDDYKRLGLVCPECKAPVFLRKASERVSTHFAHFKASDPEIVKMCELRVSGYSKEVLEKKAKEAKNQRLKLLQRWFWEVMVKKCFYSPSNKSLLVFLKELEEARKDILSTGYPIDDFCKVFAHTNTKECVEYVVQNILEDEAGEMTTKKGEMLLAGIKNCNTILHKMICEEIVDFLKSKRNFPILQKLFCIFVEFYGRGGNKLSDLENTYKYCTYNLILQICMVNWAEEFEKLDRQEKLEKERLFVSEIA